MRKMLISELIADLEKIKEQTGDVDVVAVNDYRNVHSIYMMTVGYDDYGELKDNKEECEDEYANEVVCLIS